MGIEQFYMKHYKKLLIIPFLILILSLIQIGTQYAQTGDFINKGVSLKGGISIRIETNYNNIEELESYLTEKFPKEDFDIRVLRQATGESALLIEATEGIGEDNLLNAVKEKLGDKVPEIDEMASSLELVSSSFSNDFFKTAIKALLTAFIFMAIVVFYIYRLLVPSLAVMLSAFTDIVGTIAVFNLLGINMSAGGIAALLMLIGYAVDTDILLNSRVLKSYDGTVFERFYSAFKTGTMMIATSIVAVLVGLIFTKSDVLFEVFLIIIIGLIIDMFTTWIQNAGLLMWYLEKKKGANNGQI